MMVQYLKFAYGPFDPIRFYNGVSFLAAISFRICTSGDI